MQRQSIIQTISNMLFNHSSESALHKGMNYRPDIDGLRAIAVLSVVVFHAFPNRLPGGFVGVDVFFVISGYLISLIILKQLKSDSFTIRGFYRRRIARIFPALITVLVFCLVTGWITLLPNEFSNLGKHVASGAAFISNLTLWSEVGYFDASAYDKPLLHLWSLGVEEQFYFLWPILLMIGWRMRLLVPAIFLVFAASFALNVSLINSESGAGFYSPLARFWELVAGAIAGWLVFTGKDQALTSRKVLASIFSVAGLLLICVGVYTISKGPNFPGLLALIPVIGTTLLIVSGPSALANKWVLSNRPFIWIGLISYPLYLWHWPILSYLNIYNGHFSSIPREYRAAAVIISIVLAWLTYAYIEKPLRFGGNLKAKLIALCGGMFTVFIAGITIVFAKGFSDRISIDPPAATVLFSPYPHELTNENCKDVYGAMGELWACLLSKPKKADIALIGDSHANHYYKSLAKSLPYHSIVNFGSPGCFPFVSSVLAEAPRCIKDTKTLESFIVNNEEIDTYLLSGYFSFLSSGGFLSGNIEGQRVARPLQTEQRNTFLENAKKTIDLLISEKKEIYIILDIPDLVSKPIDCLVVKPEIIGKLRQSAGSQFIRSSGKCGISYEVYLSRINEFDSLMSELAAYYPEVNFFNSREIFCQDELCLLFDDGGPVLYWNSDHLTVEGADLVIEGLIQTFPSLQK